MVIFYENNGSNIRNIIMVEHDVMTPTIPADIDTVEGMVSYYSKKGFEFISLPYELKGKIFEYHVCVNNDGNFIGLQPKGGL